MQMQNVMVALTFSCLALIGFSIRFSFYLTATMASWASHIRSLDKKERIKAMKNILFKEKKNSKKKGGKGGGNK